MRNATGGCLFATATLLATPVLAQAGGDAAIWLPLRAGSTWTYRTTSTTDPALPAVESRETVTVVGSYREGDAVRYLIARSDGEVKFEHWAIDKDGVSVRPAQKRHRISLRDDDAAPRRPLAGPVGAVTQWSHGDEDHRWTATIEGIGEPVETPHGTHEALHVRHVRGQSTCDEYFTRGIGIVAIDRVWPDKQTRLELLQHVPGQDVSALRTALMQVHLPPAWAWSPRDLAAIHWLAEGAESLCLPGHWALRTNDAERTCAFISERTTRPHDAGSAAAWRDLLHDLDMESPPPDQTLFARLVARLVAHQRNERIIEFGDCDISAGPTGPTELGMRSYHPDHGIRRVALTVHLPKSITWRQL